MAFSIPKYFVLACAFYSVTTATLGYNKWDRLSPAADAIVVDQKGEYEGSLKTISEAIEKLHYKEELQKIFIFEGIYDEQVSIPKELKGPLIVQGETTMTAGYDGNLVTITGSRSRQDQSIKSNDLTATLRVLAANVKIFNLNVVNTHVRTPEGANMALALSAQNTRQAYYGCQFRGVQDTLLANNGEQFYSNSLIAGSVDFIFGMEAVAWFQKCDILVTGPGVITANGRDSESNPSYFVFNRAKVYAKHTEFEGKKIRTYLGRPWRTFSRTVFQYSHLTEIVRPEGWMAWDDSQSTDNVYYKEYMNSGPGSNITQRVSWSGQLDRAVRPSDLFGKDYLKDWLDHLFLH